MKASFTTIFLLCAGLNGFFVVASNAEELPNKDMEMHRVNAGSPDANGWYEAKSTYGGFSVLIPGHFNDFTIHNVKPATGGVAKSHTVGGRMLDTLAKFSATCFWYSEGAPDSKKFLADGKRMKYHGCAASEKRGGRGRDMGIETTGVARTIVSATTACILIVEYPINSEKQVTGQIQPFLDSLRFSNGECSK